MKIRIIKGQNEGQVIELGNAVFTIGRELDNKFIINESGVSRHHCVLRFVGDEWFVEDLNSSNGVLVNGIRIDHGQPLKPGDVITVFSHEFELLGEGDDVAGAARPQTEGKPVAEGSRRQAVVADTGEAFLWLKIAALVVILGLIVFLLVRILRTPTTGGESVQAPAEAVEQAQTGEPAAPQILCIEPAEDAPQDMQAAAEEDAEELNEPAGAASAPPNFQTNYQKPAEPKEQPVRTEGSMLVESEPSGARIVLDGKDTGLKTPGYLKRVRQGRHRVELSLEGYEDAYFQVTYPDNLPSSPTRLRLSGGSLLVKSEPSGAHVWLERRLLGVTPCLVRDLPQGRYELVLRGPGCEPHKEKVTVSEQTGTVVEVSLTKVLGNLELSTIPADCKVFVGSVLYGVTRSQGGRNESAPLHIDNLQAGDVAVRVEHVSGVTLNGRLHVPKGDTLRKTIDLKLPTHRAELQDGRVVQGRLLEKNQAGDILIEPIGQQPERIFNPQLASLRELRSDEIRSLLEESRKNNPSLGDGGSSSASGAMEIVELEALLNRSSEEEFNASKTGKQFRLVGKPQAILPDKGNVVNIFFAKHIKCQVADLSPEERDKLMHEQPRIVVVGICAGIRDGVVTFRNCALPGDFD